MRITERKYLDKYIKSIGYEIPKLIENYDFSENRGGFEYLTKSSAVYSSNIEGNSIDLNSYMNYEMNKDKFKVGKEIEEIEDLIEAYEFAQNNKLNERNLLNCHKRFSDTLLIRSKRGKYRIEQVGVFGKSGVEYMAVEPEFVEKEMKVFFHVQWSHFSKWLPRPPVQHADSRWIKLRFSFVTLFRLSISESLILTLSDTLAPVE